ncbi:MAG: CapA family protein [Desulfuromonadaceae bacterium]|nr:CapA family protein [Desulfuromonadaceae bacterium]
MPTSTLRPVRLAAVGDLLLTTKLGATSPGRGLEALSDEIQELFASCDIVLANLECTLTGRKVVPTEPRVFTTEAQIRTLQDAGINVVTLGNNHTFDSFDEEFQHTIDILEHLDIKWCGAGFSLNEAYKPVIVKANGVSIAIIGMVDASSGMKRFAEESTSGVAPLEMNQLCRHISTLRTQVDHIVIAPHWGEERFRFPSPQQIEQAHAFADSGASLIVGHHPHVLQGMENYQDATITYSLGNFFANHVYWDNGEFLTWNRFERTGCILLAELDRTGIHNVQQIPIFDDGTTIRIEKSGWGDRCLDKANHLLARGITPTRYRRETFRIKALRPILSHLRWAKLRRIRPEHFRKAAKLFSQGMK